MGFVPVPAYYLAISEASTRTYCAFSRTRRLVFNVLCMIPFSQINLSSHAGNPLRITTASTSSLVSSQSPMPAVAFSRHGEIYLVLRMRQVHRCRARNPRIMALTESHPPELGQRLAIM